MILANLTPGQRFSIEGQAYEVDYLPAGIRLLGQSAGKTVFAESTPRVAMLYVLGEDGERIHDGSRFTADGREVNYKKALISDTRFNPIFETEEDRAKQREEDDLL